jgi:hypothetical protein
MLVAKPALLMVAAPAFDELQITDAEMSWMLLSLNVPVAMNCLVVPMLIVEFAGVTPIETKTAPVRRLLKFAFFY